jgi:hypothetical protein
MADSKTVEITEEQLQRFQRTDAMLRDVWKNDNYRRQFLPILKAVRPDDPATKELEKPDPIEERFAKLEQRNAELEKKLADDRADLEKTARIDKLRADQEAGFAALRGDRWTSDGIDQVKKVMDEKGILDVAIAAAYVEKQMPKQAPITSGYGSWDFLNTPDKGDDDIKALIESKGENNALLSKLVHEAIQEVRGQTPRR